MHVTDLLPRKALHLLSFFFHSRSCDLCVQSNGFISAEVLTIVDTELS